MSVDRYKRWVVPANCLSLFEFKRTIVPAKVAATPIVLPSSMLLKTCEVFSLFRAINSDPFGVIESKSALAASGVNELPPFSDRKN